MYEYIYIYLNPARVWNFNPLPTKNKSRVLKFDILGGSRYVYNKANQLLLWVDFAKSRQH